MAVFTILGLNKATPQLEARPAGNSYLLPMDVESTTGVFNSGVADGASANAFVLNSSNAFATAGADILSLQNNLVEKVKFDKDGGAYFNVGGGRKEIQIDNDGNDPRIFAGASSLWMTIGGTNAALGLKFDIGSEGALFRRDTNRKIKIDPLLNTISSAYYGADFTISGPARDNQDETRYAFNLTGAAARTSATVNLVGGDLNVTGGAGASGSSGLATGGNLNLNGGTGYGTGVAGQIISATILATTSDPGISGALWNNAGTIAISP